MRRGNYNATCYKIMRLRGIEAIKSWNCKAKGNKTPRLRGYEAMRLWGYRLQHMGKTMRLCFYTVMRLQGLGNYQARGYEAISWGRGAISPQGLVSRCLPGAAAVGVTLIFRIAGCGGPPSLCLALHNTCTVTIIHTLCTKFSTYIPWYISTYCRLEFCTNHC